MADNFGIHRGAPVPQPTNSARLSAPQPTNAAASTSNVTRTTASGGTPAFTNLQYLSNI